MAQNVGSDEFDSSDFFALELLRYADFDIYQSLKDRKSELITYNLAPNGLHRMVLQEEEVNRIKNQIVQWILKKVFLNGVLTSSSVCYVNNYRRYFSYRIEQDELRASEFLRWINEPQDLAYKIFTSLINKVLTNNSLLFQFSIYNISKFSINELERYFHGLLRLFLKDYKSRDSVKAILIDKLHPKENPLIDSDDFFRWLSPELGYAESVDQILKLSDLFKSLKNNDSGLTSRLHLLETDNLKRYLKTEVLDAMDILNREKPLRILYSNSLEWESRTVLSKDDDFAEERYASSVLLDPICAFFESNKSDDRNKFVENLTCYEYEDPFGETYLEILPEEVAIQEITSIFGSYSNYEKYLDSSFKS